MSEIAINRSAMNDLFLAQSYLDSWNEYQYVLTHNKAPRWDWFVITASNEEQASAYRLQIERRQALGLLAHGTRFAVIADPEGKRVGSGGATLNVLRHIARETGRTDFTGLRIALLHSGGDSKRIPQYSALGKLFSYVPRQLPDGRVSTLFDEFILSLSGLPGRMSDGLLVLSGDVLLLFNALQIDLQLEGAACISMKALVQTGVNHGVFLSDSQGRVERFLHKLPEAQLRALGAVNERGCVDIDTGAIWLSGQVTTALYSVVLRDGQPEEELFDRYVNSRERLSFYGDFLFPLAHASTLEDYQDQAAEGEAGPALEACRLALWQALHGYPLHIIRMAPAEFIHFGTTAELRTLMLSAGSRYSHLDWNSHVLAVGQGADLAMVNSIVREGAQAQAGCYLEDTELLPGARLGSGCVLSHVTFGAELPAGSLLHMLPQAGGGFAARLCAVGDNPKLGLRDGGTLLGCSLEDFLRVNAIRETDVWPGGDRSLWTARLYPLAATADEAVQASLALLRMARGEAPAQAVAAWLAAPRISLMDSFERADVGAILRQSAALEDRIRSSLFITRLAEGCKASEAAQALGDRQALVRRAAVALSQAQCLPPETRSRVYRTLASLSDERSLALEETSEALEDACYRLINERIQEVTFSQLSSQPPRPLAGPVSVSLPVRVNWGGGWSDTPPYCLERGGTVFNAAITLKGQRPVKVAVEPLAQPLVVLRSVDLGVSRVASSFAELRPDADPNDPFGLAKAALAVQGLLPDPSREPTFDQWLQGLGGGFCISSEVDVPKGSGLGTSSILAGALVQALSRAFGQPLTLDALFGRVLCIEQMLSTGGGWQDQVGGIVPGIKLIRSAPGAQQRLQVRCVDLSQPTLQELTERFVLVYTGQRRLARNLLRDIMGNYLLNDPQTVQILNDIQQLAVLMCFDLERGDVDGFARLLDRHWELSRKLDPGSTNTCIDQIVAECRPYIDGVMIAGAGGGGFLQMVLKRGVTAAQLSDCLADVFQDNGIAVWESAFSFE